MADEETKICQLAAPATGGQKRFEVKKWNAVALWSWGKCYAERISCRWHSAHHRWVHCRHCCRQLRHLQKSYHGLMYWMPSQSSIGYQRGVYRGVGCLQYVDVFNAFICRQELKLWRCRSRLSFSLYFSLVEDKTSVSFGYMLLWLVIGRVFYM